MTKTEWEAFEKALLDRGYKKWTRAKYGEEDFDMSKLFKNGDEDMYQLIFRFWDFEQFKEGAGYSIDWVVLPCIDGRMDAICSSMGNGLSTNIEFAERFAKEYYEFIIERIFQEGYEKAQKDLGWISVKDRLPKDDGWYLTCVRMEHLGNTPQIVCPLFFWKKYKRWEDADGLYNGKIDYWMPILKLPNKDE